MQPWHGAWTASAPRDPGLLLFLPTRYPGPGLPIYLWSGVALREPVINDKDQVP